MSGSTDTERQPTTDAELMRDVDRRIDAQEQPESTRAGEWTLSTQDGTSNLVACHSGGGCVTIAAKPPEGTDPDGEYIEPPEIVPVHKTPRIKVKGGPKSIPNASLQTYDQWNNGVGTADYEEPAGTWTWTASTFTIPEDGDYSINVYVPWTAVANGQRSLEVRHNGTIVMIDTTDAAAVARTQNTQCVVELRCLQGDTISAGLFQDSTASVSAGGANFGQAWAQISITKLADADIPEHERGTL